MGPEVSAMFWMGFRRMMAEVGHQAGWCKCKDFWGRWDRPCVVGLEILALEKADAQYRAWDAIGLGYVGQTRYS